MSYFTWRLRAVGPTAVYTRGISAARALASEGEPCCFRWDFFLTDWTLTCVGFSMQGYGNVLGKTASRFPIHKDYSYWWCWWHDLSTSMTSSSDGVSHQQKPPQQWKSGGQHTLLNHICLKGQYFKCRHLITLDQTTKIDVPILLVQAAAEWFRIPVFSAYIWDVKYKWINVRRGRGCEVWECVTGAWNSWSPLLGKKKKTREKSLISHNMTRYSM